MPLKRHLIVLAASVAATAGSPVAADPGQYTLHISGVVPVVCRATIENSIVPSDTAAASLGTLNEFCNSPNGYQIYVDHSPELANSRLVVNGQQVRLNDNGSTLIVQSDTPARRSRNLVLNLPKGKTAGNLSFRIVPL